MNNKLSIVLITIISMMVMASCGNAEVPNETSVESSTQDQIEEEEITVTDTDSTTASSTVEIVAEQDAEETLAAEEPTEQIEKTVDLKAIWGDTDVEEYVDPVLNVHFYLPKTVEVSKMEHPKDWEVTGSTIYITGEGMKNEAFMTTGAETKEVSLNSDPATLCKTFQNIGNMEYLLYLPSVESWPEPSQASLDFYEKYGDRIIASAWVPADNPNPYYTFSVGSDDGVISEGNAWLFHDIPSSIIQRKDGKAIYVVGTHIPAGHYQVRVTLGYGSMEIIDKSDISKFKQTGIDGAKINFDQELDLEEGDRILLDADPKEALAITFISEDNNGDAEDNVTAKNEDSGSAAITNDEIVERAKKRSGAPIAELDYIDDNGHLIIHLYEQMPDHTATWDWYDIDPKTLTGTDILGEKVDLN